MRTTNLLRDIIIASIIFMTSLSASDSFYMGTTPCCGPDHIKAPMFSGGYDLGGAWLYLQPISTDGDLQYGTHLTLTDDPDNLTAYVLQLTPDYRNAYKGHIGYYIPCTNWSANLSYFYFDSKDHQLIDGLSTSPFQFIQNFLGGSFLTAEASEKQRLDKVDLTAGNHFIVDDCYNINPFIGVSYGRVKRELSVYYTGYNFDPSSADLPGRLESCYWGVGPVAGYNFSFPLFCSLSLEGHFGGGVLIGNIESETHSSFQRSEEINEQFNSNSCYHRAVPFFNSGIELSYTYARAYDCLGFKLSVGYLVDYYFNAVDRINPFNGYVNNPNTYPVKASSNLGLGGPYVYLSIMDNPVPKESGVVADYISIACRPQCGLFAGMTNSWLVASSSNRDLDYAILHTEGKNDKYLHADPSHTWAGTYYIGYRLPCNIDFRARYFHFDSSATDKTEAGENQGISSLNASGPADVRFGNTSSKVNYELNQFDVIAGKYIQPCRELNIYSYVGMRYTDLDRTQRNGYFDGVPPLTTETKTNRLKSMMSGIGPIFGLDPEFSLSNGNFGVSAHLDVALLVGSIRSTLDQVNTGTEADSSNDLSLRSTQWIIPVVDLRGGVFYKCSWNNCLSFKIELGYQFSEYYRSINLVYPTLLTGLEQRNSDLKLQGPYISLDIFGY